MKLTTIESGISASDAIINPYFYSFVSKPGQKKVRQCLKCLKPFTSMHSGNRVCSNCVHKNAKLPYHLHSNI